MVTHDFPDVTLLITHYCRSQSLARLLCAFQDLDIKFGDIVVSDDGSSARHLELLEQLSSQFNFRLILAPVNRGLGHNINKGQDAVRTPYTFYVQEDFVPTTALLPVLQHARTTLHTHPEVDLLRFYAYYAYPYLKPMPDAHGFSEMRYKPWFTNTTKIYQYSDHPHLRRSNFMQKFGRYVEGIKSDKTEYLMCVSFIKKGGRALFYNDFKALFLQENSAAEPSTVSRADWRQSSSPLVGVVRTLYRQVKYNYDLHVRAGS